MQRDDRNLERADKTAHSGPGREESESQGMKEARFWWQH